MLGNESYYSSNKSWMQYPVMLRYYVPENSNGEIAGVELPSIVGKKTDLSGEIDLTFAQIQNPDAGPLAAKLTLMAEVVSTFSNSIGFWKLDSSNLLANNGGTYPLNYEKNT